MFRCLSIELDHTLFDVPRGTIESETRPIENVPRGTISAVLHYAASETPFPTISGSRLRKMKNIHI